MILQRVVGKHLKTTMACLASSSGTRQFRNLLILDVEATCDNVQQPEPQEIIELPCLNLNLETLRVEAEFHRYIRPVKNPILTPFCTELTGIVQDMVEKEAAFPTVFQDFSQWLSAQGLIRADNRLVDSAAFVTCGDWDLKNMMKRQCLTSAIPFPHFFQEWINIKKIFFKANRIWPKGMMHMLEISKISHEGRHHSGIDDCRNIANIARNLARNNANFTITSYASK